MGRVDLFHSRRANYVRVEYWVRDEQNAVGTPSQWIYANLPSGTFHARPISAKSTQMDAVNGVWAVDGSRMTLVTDDEIEDVSRGTLLRFWNELWIVEAVQRSLHRKESEFAKHPDWEYTLSARRG